MFRNPLAPAAAVCLSAAGALGLVASAFLLNGSYAAAITEKILRSGIRTESALHAWTLINAVINLVCGICPTVTAIGMWLALDGQAARGMNLLANGAKWLLRAVKISGAATLAVLIFRSARYILAIARKDEAVYLLFSSLVMEGLMVVQAVFLFRMLCRFLDSAEGTAAGLGYTLSSGRLDAGSLQAFTSTGLLVLGVLGLALSIDRLFTVTIASDGFQQYYKLLTAAHPGQWMSAASLFVGGVGNILLSYYLKFCKRTSERAIFYEQYGKLSK